MEVPAFLARQFYVAGSLRNVDGGFQLQARNPLGDGTLVRVGPLAIDGRAVPVESVTAQRDGETDPVGAADVSHRRPIRVRRGDAVTLHIYGESLTPGEHELEVTLVELNLGALHFTLRERVIEPG